MKYNDEVCTANIMVISQEKQVTSPPPPPPPLLPAPSTSGLEAAETSVGIFLVRRHIALERRACSQRLGLSALPGLLRLRGSDRIRKQC